MRVAIDAAPLLDPPTGVARYTRELMTALEVRGVDVVPYAVSFRGGRDRSIERWRVPARLAQWCWRRFDRPGIKKLVGSVDLVHGTNFVLPSLDGIPGVVTVHDLSFLSSDAFPGADRLRDLVPWSVGRAEGVVVPSNTIAAELCDRLDVSGDRVEVTHEGVSSVFFGASPLSDSALEGLGIHRPFALAVGTLEPRKNLHRLLDAWRSLPAETAGWTLALAGPAGWGPELPQVRGVVSLGWVGDATLPGLLAAAEIFCYPSLYEGFGLPPLEAMAAGTPALVGRYSAAPEILGDAALLVDPSDVGEIARGLASLLGDAGLRRTLALAGKGRAAGYTWESAAKATQRAYEKAVGA